MRSVTIAVAAGLTLMCIAVGVTLLGSPTSVLSTNRPAGSVGTVLASTTQSADYCQAHEVLPRGASAIRVWLDVAAGPRVRLVVYSAGRPIASGEQGSNWIGGAVTIPVKPLSYTARGVTVCASFRLHDETLLVQGSPTSAAMATRNGGQVLPGKMWIDYMRPGGRSWASLLPVVIRNMGFGRAGTGTWVVYFALALLLAVAALASGALVRELR
jgi:hypothetical protein